MPYSYPCILLCTSVDMIYFMLYLIYWAKLSKRNDFHKWLEFASVSPYPISKMEILASIHFRDEYHLAKYINYVTKYLKHEP